MNNSNETDFSLPALSARKPQNTPIRNSTVGGLLHQFSLLCLSIWNTSRLLLRKLRHKRRMLDDKSRALEFSSMDSWLVVRIRESEAPEVWAFSDEKEARCFYDQASANWTETYLCPVVQGPGMPQRSQMLCALKQQNATLRGLLNDQFEVNSKLIEQTRLERILMLMGLIYKKDPQLLPLIDRKCLYNDNLVWQIYHDICGGNLDRFIYHVCVELPDQQTGKPNILGPYMVDAICWEEDEYKTFLAARSWGKPGSLWALKNPPQNPNYRFPLMPDGTERPEDTEPHQ